MIIYKILPKLQYTDHIKYKNGSIDYLIEYKKLHKNFKKLEKELNFNLRNTMYNTFNYSIIEYSKQNTSDLNDLIYHHLKLLNEEKHKFIEKLKYAIFIMYSSEEVTYHIHCINNKIHNANGPALLEIRDNYRYNHYYLNEKEYNDNNHNKWEKDRLIYLRKDKIKKLMK